MRRSELKRGRRRPRAQAWELDIPRSDFHEAARGQRACAVSGRSKGTWDAHHVVEKGWLKRNAPDFVWDSRNALRVSRRVHEQHTSATRRIPMSCLTDANIEFAFEVMGAFALYYLRARYEDMDERVELAFEAVQDAVA